MKRRSCQAVSFGEGDLNALFCRWVGLSTAGSGLFVCHPTGPLAQAGRRTDGGFGG